jgi:3-hydroxyisobutyrate dehydrogenase
MARHLAAAGHDSTVYNRSPEKARAWVEAHGGKRRPARPKRQRAPRR